MRGYLKQPRFAADNGRGACSRPVDGRSSIDWGPQPNPPVHRERFVDNRVRPGPASVPGPRTAATSVRAGSSADPRCFESLPGARSTQRAASSGSRASIRARSGSTFFSTRRREPRPLGHLNAVPLGRARKTAGVSTVPRPSIGPRTSFRPRAVCRAAGPAARGPRSARSAEPINAVMRNRRPGRPGGADRH